MAIGDNSYGSALGIASRVPRWIDKTTLTFDTSTNPTLSQVEAFIDEVSALMNVYLSELNVDIPITQADVKKVMNMFVNDEVASIVLGIHGSGRFAPKAGKSAGTGQSRFVRILKDFQEFIKTNQYGLEKLGVHIGRSLQALSSYDPGISPLLSRDTLDIS